MNLSSWDFEQDGAIALKGKWNFCKERSNDTLSQVCIPITVPEDWNQNPALESNQKGVYRLMLQLPVLRAPLSLRINGVATAYRLSVNGKLYGGVGIVAQGNHAGVPAYEQKEFPLPNDCHSVILELEVSNHHHYQSGLLVAPILCSSIASAESSRNYFLFGGIILGVILLNILFYTFLSFYLKNTSYYFFYALLNVCVLLHFLCLVDRFLYTLFPIGWWAFCYKVELITIFAALICCVMFYNSFFSLNLNRKLRWGIVTLFLLEILFTLLMPAPLFTYIDLLVRPTILLTTLGFSAIFLYSIKHQKPGAIQISLMNGLLLGILIHQNFILNSPVHDLQWLHMGLLVYMIGTSLVLFKNIINIFISEKELSRQVVDTNEKLERQNKSLEDIVDRRTKQLIEVEKEKYQLQLERKEQDLNILSATNLMKLQFNKNLIQELEELPSSGKELKMAVTTLITRLKNQYAIEEKLDVLQTNLDKVNAEFYNRLSQRFPELSKTERELCAYIKLNLSSKDIADLRKTSLNTINVTRSRLRKKLGLTRDDELEFFIQSF
ncbi:MAG: hypothetical protein MUF42_09400 [Cytophagaceae bacterium]|nr:hypothetical protein [Cytophagaceae bacterium]